MIKKALLSKASCFFLWLTLLFLTFNATLWAQSAKSAEDVFILSASMEKDNNLNLFWQIEEPNYLYQDYITINVIEPEDMALGTVKFPKGEIKDNVVFGRITVFKKELGLSFPLINKSAADKGILSVSYIGCLENGNCYPPVNRKVYIDFKNNSVVLDNEIAKSGVPGT